MCFYFNVEPVSVSGEPDATDDNDGTRNGTDGEDDEAPEDFSLAIARQRAVDELHQLQVSQHRYEPLKRSVLVQLV